MGAPSRYRSNPVSPTATTSSEVASRASSSSSRSPKPPAEFGCRPTQAKTSSCSRASAIAPRFESSPNPTVRIFRTPDSRAAATSSTGAGSHSSRWECESIKRAPARAKGLLLEPVGPLVGVRFARAGIRGPDGRLQADGADVGLHRVAQRLVRLDRGGDHLTRGECASVCQRGRIRPLDLQLRGDRDLAVGSADEPVDDPLLGPQLALGQVADEILGRGAGLGLAGARRGRKGQHCGGRQACDQLLPAHRAATVLPLPSPSLSSVRRDLRDGRTYPAGWSLGNSGSSSAKLCPPPLEPNSGSPLSGSASASSSLPVVSGM